VSLLLIISGSFSDIGNTLSSDDLACSQDVTPLVCHLLVTSTCQSREFSTHCTPLIDRLLISLDSLWTLGILARQADIEIFDRSTVPHLNNAAIRTAVGASVPLPVFSPVFMFRQNPCR
jgi:hypothetical protein